MKLVFLDIDGVLIHQAHIDKIRGTCAEPYLKFDPIAVTRLNRITGGTGACIVVSSSWRIEYQGRLDELLELLRVNGVSGKVIGATEILDTDRGIEIQDYLDNVDCKVSSFVILDDSSLFLKKDCEELE